MHFCSPSFTQCTAARFQSRPGGEYVVNHEDRFAGAPSRFDGAADVSPAFRGREALLAPPAFGAGQRARTPRLAAGTRQRLRQPRRLIEAAAGKPGPVHRRRRKKIRLGQSLPGCRTHPPRKHREAIAAAAALQIEDQSPRVVVVNKRCPCGVIGRLAAAARTADCAWTGFVRQRETALRAQRVGQKFQFTPKARLNHTRTIDNGVGQK